MATQADEIRDLKHAVFGNGSPGLKTRVTVMETQFKSSITLLKWLVSLAVPSAVSLVICAASLIVKVFFT